MSISAWIAIPLLVAWSIYDARNRKKRDQQWEQTLQESVDWQIKKKQEIIDLLQKLSVWRYRLAAEVKAGRINIEALAAVDYWVLNDDWLESTTIFDELDLLLETSSIFEESEEEAQTEAIQALIDHAYFKIALDHKDGVAGFGHDFRSLAERWKAKKRNS